MTKLTKMALEITQSPFQSTLLWLKLRGLDRLMDMTAPKSVQTWKNFSNSCLAVRIDEEKKLQGKDLDRTNIRKDMFHFLFQAKDPETGGPGYTQEELVQENELLMIAGADTTSTTFAAMFFYLTRNPDVHRKLTSEIRATFKSVDDIESGPQLTSCRYLRAFIDEALRMNPPIGSDMSREVLAGGIDIEGELIPAGIDVAVSLYSLHHNEEFIPNAFHFKPERWLTDAEDGDAAADNGKSKSAFAPFSMGVRGCAGKNLAYLEMSIVMAKILYRADVRAVQGDELGAGRPDLMWGRRNKTHFQTRDVFVSAREGPMVQFKPAQW